MNRSETNLSPKQATDRAPLSAPAAPAGVVNRFRSPLAVLAAAFALGIVWANSFRDPAGIYWFVSAALFCILAGLILLRAGWDKAAIGLCLAGMVFAGVADSMRWQQRFPLNHVRYVESRGADLTEPVRLEGRVISTPYRTGYGMQFDVDAHSVESHTRILPVTGKVRLSVDGPGGTDGRGNPLQIHFGDDIRALVRLHRPQFYQNPGSFNFRRWMEDIGDLYWVGTIKNSRQLEIIGHPLGFQPAVSVESVRQRLLRGIDDIYPPWTREGRYGAVLKAVLWGDRTALDSTTIEDFRKTGLYHLLVIAGLHVGLITLLVEFLLRALEVPRVTRAVMVLGFLATYAFLVEQRAATLRATLMIGLYLVARMISRDHSSLNTLGGVALLLLYFRPAWLMDSGFQLSFGAALLIVTVAVPILSKTTEPYRRALRRLDDVLLDDYYSPRLAQIRLEMRMLVRGLCRRSSLFARYPILARHTVVTPLKFTVWVVDILIFSAVLQLGLLLPMVETFHRVTFTGVGLNALAIPVMTLLLAIALPTNLLSVVSPLIAAWPAKLLSAVMWALFAMAHVSSLAPWLSYRVPAPPSWVAWGFCAAFVLAGLTLYFARRAAGASLAACAIFVAVVAMHPFAPRLPRGVLQMTALDCGTGDALFLVLPNGTTMLLDAGGSPTRGAWEGGLLGRRWNSGEDIVSPYLWSLGLEKIDVVALTHAHADYAGGIFAVLENFRVGEFWHPPQPESPDLAALLDAVAQHGIPTRTLMAGDALGFKGTAIQVLWPATAPPSERSSIDDYSLVMRVSAGGTNFLLPGDAGRGAERGILASLEPVESQVLMVAHQGAKAENSSQFLAHVGPRVALISPEAGSRSADLPNPDTLRALESLGARIFRTDTDGATTVEAKDGSLMVRTFKHQLPVVIGPKVAP